MRLQTILAVAVCTFTAIVLARAVTPDVSADHHQQNWYDIGYHGEEHPLRPGLYLWRDHSSRPQRQNMFFEIPKGAQLELWGIFLADFPTPGTRSGNIGIVLRDTRSDSFLGLDVIFVKQWSGRVAPPACEDEFAGEWGRGVFLPSCESAIAETEALFDWIIASMRSCEESAHPICDWVYTPPPPPTPEPPPVRACTAEDVLDAVDVTDQLYRGYNIFEPGRYVFTLPHFEEYGSHPPLVITVPEGLELKLFSYTPYEVTLAEKHTTGVRNAGPWIRFDLDSGQETDRIAYPGITTELFDAVSESACIVVD